VTLTTRGSSELLTYVGEGEKKTKTPPKQRAPFPHRVREKQKEIRFVFPRLGI